MSQLIALSVNNRFEKVLLEQPCTISRARNV